MFLKDDMLIYVVVISYIQKVIYQFLRNEAKYQLDPMNVRAGNILHVGM